MALTTCQDCGHQVSTRASNCPQCGAPQSAQQSGSRHTASSESGYGNIFPDMRAPDSKKSNLFGWVVIGVVVAAFGSCVLNTPKRTGPSVTDALGACRTAILQVAKDPDTAKIPYVDGAESPSQFTFTWNRETSLIRMRNGLGLEVPATAICRFSKSANQVSTLQLDDQILIAR